MRVAISLETIQKADRMHRSGLSWAVVADRLQMKRSTITVLTNRYRRGCLSGMEARRIANHGVDMYESFFLPLVKQGKTLKEIAAAWGVKTTTAYERMAHRGYNSEVRRAIALEIAP